MQQITLIRFPDDWPANQRGSKENRQEFSPQGRDARTVLTKRDSSPPLVPLTNVLHWLTARPSSVYSQGPIFVEIPFRFTSNWIPSRIRLFIAQEEICSNFVLDNIKLTSHRVMLVRNGSYNLLLMLSRAIKGYCLRT